MKVSEVMNKEVKSLTPQMTASEGLDKLFALQISGLPVIDDKGILVGMFTEKGVLKEILPSYLDKVGKFVYEENPKGIREKVARLSHLRVKDLMRKDVITVTEDTALCEVARIMLTQKIRRIPVLNKEGKVVGIVARGDIVKTLTRE